MDDILGKTHISDFDKFCVEQKDSMNPEQNAFSEYIKDLLKEKKITQQMVFLKADIPEKYGYKLKILRSRLFHSSAVISTRSS